MFLFLKKGILLFQLIRLLIHYLKLVLNLIFLIFFMISLNKALLMIKDKEVEFLRKKTIATTKKNVWVSILLI